MAVDEALYREIRERLKFDIDFTSFLKSRAEVDSPQITKDNILGLGALLSMVDQTKDRKIAFGSLTLTFAANAISATVTTAHGLGVAPRVWTQPADFGALATGPLVYVGNIGVANFDCKAQDAAGAARTGTVVVYWLAIG